MNERQVAESEWEIDKWLFHLACGRPCIEELFSRVRENVFKRRGLFPQKGNLLAYELLTLISVDKSWQIADDRSEKRHLTIIPSHDSRERILCSVTRAVFSHLVLSRINIEIRERQSTGLLTLVFSSLLLFLVSQFQWARRDLSRSNKDASPR